MEHLSFIKLNSRAVLPERAHKSDAGLDLSSIEELTLQPGERHPCQTGLSVAIPHRWAGLIVPRSGLAARYGITIVNSPGLIDAGYRGELKVILLNTGHEPYQIEVGSRIAQLVVVQVDLGEPQFVEALPDSLDGRDQGGFGSTG
jgi:dUTP pyrophosphatase